MSWIGSTSEMEYVGLPTTPTNVRVPRSQTPPRSNLTSTSATATATLSAPARSLPREIYASGMPLMWRGFNGRWTLVTDKPNESHYMLNNGLSYFGIRIIPMDIVLRDGRWVMEDAYFGRPYMVSTAKTPLSGWGDGISFSTTPGLHNWWNSNWHLLVLLLIVVLLVRLFR